MIYSNNDLSNIDIEKIIEKLHLSDNFEVVYSKDRIPKLKKEKNYVINMQKKH